MKVIGIDPAPSKETVIYDGEKFMTKDAVALKKYLDDEVEEDTLICWDAPLTGGMPENFKGGYNPFYQRKIEQLINEKVKQPDNTKIKGISTMGYAGCSHWAITQYCLGFPQIVKPKTDSPFTLITEPFTIQDKQSLKRQYVVEVHPALALWLWLNKDIYITKWDYKDDKETLKNLAEKLFKELKTQPVTTMKDGKFQVTIFETKKPKDMTDDHLDAYIAWLLGTLWLKNEVILVGNKNTGAILLPNDADISEKWRIELDKYK